MQIQISEGVRSALIVEDEGLVAMMMEDLLEDMGVGQVHTCTDLQSALHAARTATIDCAVLDLWLRGESVLPVADILAERGIPFIFSTGSDAQDIAERHAHRPMISKPFADDDFRLILLDTMTLHRHQTEPAEWAAGRVAPFGATD